MNHNGLPPNWKHSTIGDLAQVRTGKTPSRADPRNFGGNIPWVKTGEVTDGVIHTTEEHLSERGKEESSSEVFPTGSILVALYGQGQTRGRTALLGVPAATNQACAVIFPSSKADQRFLWWWLRASYVPLRDMGRGGNQPNLNLDMVRTFGIPVPPLPDQRRVAAILDKADRLRRIRRYALELGSPFLTVVFLDLFGRRFNTGPTCQFGDLVAITGGGTPSRSRPEFFRGHIPWLTSKDMRGDYIWDTQEHITEEGIENSCTNLVPADSILVVVKSKVLMHRLPVALAKVPMCHGQDIKSIQCSGKLHHEFARFVLKYHEGRLLNLARGANTEGLTLPMLKELPVPQVDLSDQQKFAALVERTERMRAVQREALRQAEHLFQALLHRAFTTGL